jgi:hypothetical protein
LCLRMGRLAAGSSNSSLTRMLSWSRCCCSSSGEGRAQGAAAGRLRRQKAARYDAARPAALDVFVFGLLAGTELVTSLALVLLLRVTSCPLAGPRGLVLCKVVVFFK